MRKRLLNYFRMVTKLTSRHWLLLGRGPQTMFLPRKPYWIWYHFLKCSLCCSFFLDRSVGFGWFLHYFLLPSHLPSHSAPPFLVLYHSTRRRVTGTSTLCLLHCLCYEIEETLFKRNSRYCGILANSHYDFKFLLGRTRPSEITKNSHHFCPQFAIFFLLIFISFVN